MNTQDDNAISLTDIVLKLTGPVEPLGETHGDAQRYQNLQMLIGLMRDLHVLVDRVATENKDRAEFSMSRAGKACVDYITWLGAQQ